MVYKNLVKRILDIAISLMGLLFLSIPMLIIFVLVNRKLGTPAIFKQERPGLNEKVFVLYKFRTMTDEKDDNGKLLPDHRRLTKFGEFLRKSSLDELPELINVLKGDMSLIGPRPLRIQYLPYYTESEKKRHTVRPGITGYAQINGRNNLEWDKRLAMDILYVNKVSFLFDLHIFLVTIKKVFMKDDVVMGEDRTILDFDKERSAKNGSLS